MASIDIPPPVAGDPAGMRALAANLRAVAESIEPDDGALRTVVDVMTFRGPAAVRVRGRVDGATGGPALGELHRTADLLVRAAAQVEDAQAERARLLRLAAAQAGGDGGAA
jgi:hypothetical protein